MCPTGPNDAFRNSWSEPQRRPERKSESPSTGSRMGIIWQMVAADPKIPLRFDTYPRTPVGDLYAI
jgi:hypothetical protein